LDHTQDYYNGGDQYPAHHRKSVQNKEDQARFTLPGDDDGPDNNEMGRTLDSLDSGGDYDFLRDHTGDQQKNGQETFPLPDDDSRQDNNNKLNRALEYSDSSGKIDFPEQEKQNKDFERFAQQEEADRNNGMGHTRDYYNLGVEDDGLVDHDEDHQNEDLERFAHLEDNDNDESDHTQEYSNPVGEYDIPLENGEGHHNFDEEMFARQGDDYARDNDEVGRMRDYYNATGEHDFLVDHADIGQEPTSDFWSTNDDPSWTKTEPPISISNGNGRSPIEHETNGYCFQSQR